MKKIFFVGYDSHCRPVFVDKNNRYICETKTLGMRSESRSMNLLSSSFFYKLDGFDSEPDVPVNEDVSIQNLAFILPPNDGSDYRVSIDILPDDWEIAGLEEAFSEPDEMLEEVE
jgi:hypothetical protein